MNANGKLQGGVIVLPEQHSYGLVQLFTARLRDRIDLVYYPHANAVELDYLHDFIIVLSYNDLEGLIRNYRVKGYAPPAIIHIDEPQIVDQIDYAWLFPEAEIAPIAQPRITAKDTTLKLMVFREIIDYLEERVH
jgi:hypothetical protein